MTDTYAPQTSDFGARDARVRCQTYTVLRARADIPLEDFHRFWRDVHGPLCARLDGLGYYVQHHFDRTRTANLWPRPDGIGEIDVILDGMVEIGFPDAAHEARFAKASRILFDDERNFIAHDVAYALPQGSVTLVDRDPDPAPIRAEPGHHLHLHLHGEDLAALRTWAQGYAEAIAQAPGIEKVRLHRPEPYDNARPAPDAPEVDHRTSPERATLAMIEMVWANRLAAERFAADAAHRALLDTMAGPVSALAAYRVSDVYTYVRDGEITLAGLRGASAAQLIDALGAENQTRAAVSTLFHAA